MHNRYDQAAVSNIMVFHGEGQKLENVDRSQVWRALWDHGAVLFRGFAADSASFVAFTDRYCGRFLRHVVQELRPTRSADGTLVGVGSGNNAISLHAEMNYAPRRPDLLWFHCTQPASCGGGDTIVADSRRMLAALSPYTRAAFERRRICYRLLLEPSHWQQLSPIRARPAVIAVINALPNLRASAADGDRIQVDFRTWAIRPTGRDGRPGFINSIENVLEYGHKVTFADGEPIAPALLEDIAHAAQICVEPIRWQPRDVVMIDNSRMLHGRPSFEGTGRHIDARFGMLALDVKCSKWLHSLTARVARARPLAAVS